MLFQSTRVAKVFGTILCGSAYDDQTNLVSDFGRQSAQCVEQNSMPLRFGDAADHSDSNVIGPHGMTNGKAHRTSPFKCGVVKDVQLRNKAPVCIQKGLRGGVRARHNFCYVSSTVFGQDNCRFLCENQM